MKNNIEPHRPDAIISKGTDRKGKTAEVIFKRRTLHVRWDYKLHIWTDKDGRPFTF